ncbi:hypothetical protein [Herpetosiphon geysericola]|uniref:Uncharacterized protein n=1 Tax=Herpetosiphon geysericola TaxID=70996 RepID=A0A0P6YRS5_9CHLR|nr:hypothetical protein [Herpetosiphon geysericola]KPL85955.1 hypothetical protein SE18_13725 [Herpetosiphon geysericola]
MPSESAIEPIAKHRVTSVHAEHMQIDATRLRIDQTLIPTANLAKVAQVKIYKAFPTMQVLILAIGLTITMGLRSNFLIEDAQNVLSAGLALWIIYLFFDYLGWRDQHGLLVVPSTGPNEAIVFVHENPDFIGQVLGAVEQVIDKSAASYSIDWKKQTLEAK